MIETLDNNSFSDLSNKMWRKYEEIMGMQYKSIKKHEN
jgi:hypothetical protein